MMTHENPTPTQWLQQVRNLIAQDRLDEVFALLRDLLDGSPALNEVLQQSARFQRIRQQIRLGTASQETAELTQNQIRAGLLELLHELEHPTEIPTLQETFGQALAIAHSKNIVSGSSLTARGDIHLGDKQVTQNAEKIYNIDNIDNANFS